GGYLINGSKMWITNGRYGDTFALAAKTDAKVDPPHKGISAFVIEKSAKDDGAFKVVRDIDKLGYRGVETCELYFDNLFVPAKNLIDGRDTAGPKQCITRLQGARDDPSPHRVRLPP